MATLNEVKTRTGLSDGDAEQYIAMAEDRVRLYLNYADSDDISRFSSVISDVACLLYDRQRSIQTAQTSWLQTAGLSGKSYSEGPVSVHETYGGQEGSGITVGALYDNQISAVLGTLARWRKARVVKC